jgi:hypothetical protein
MGSCMQIDSRAYFTNAVSYGRKIVMKLATGVKVIKLLQM